MIWTNPRRNLEENMEMNIVSKPVTRSLNETPNIAYGVIEQQQGQRGSRKEDVKEEVYYEIVGTETKRENVAPTSKDRSMLESLYVLT